jgi:hypothetical protein
MANKKITALTAITALDVADVLPVADVSIPETKKITAANLWLGGFNAHKDIDGTFAANSDLVFPTQKAAKTYVDTAAATYLPLAGGTLSGSLGISAGNSLSVGDSYIDHILEKTAAHGVAIDGLTIKDGNIVLSGGQIAFPATANPSAGANTLDDYEEGVWTPALEFGGNAVGMAYETQTGYYTKIGRLLYLFAIIGLTAKGTSTGSATITGLPFSINLASEPVTLFVDRITFGGTMEGSAAGTTVSLYDISEAGGLGYITNDDFADTSALRISITTFV